METRGDIQKVTHRLSAAGLWWGGLKKKKVRTDQITLTQFDPTEGVGPDDLLQKRPIKGKGGKKIDVEFYWPPAPTGPTAGYTAPLKGGRRL